MQVEQQMAECQAACIQMQAHNTYMQQVLDTMTPVSFDVAAWENLDIALSDTALPDIHEIHNVIGMLTANRGPHTGSYWGLYLPDLGESMREHMTGSPSWYNLW